MNVVEIDEITQNDREKQHQRLVELMAENVELRMTLHVLKSKLALMRDLMKAAQEHNERVTQRLEAAERGSR